MAQRGGWRGGRGGSGGGGRGGGGPRFPGGDDSRPSSAASFHQPRGGYQQGGGVQLQRTAVLPKQPKVLTENIPTEPPLVPSIKPDPEAAKKQTKALEQSTKKMMLEDEERPRRPDKGGTTGKQLKMLANHFRIILPTGKGYHYDLEIRMRGRDNRVSAAPKAVLRTAVQYWLRRIGLDPYNFAFDGKRNLYARERISFVRNGEQTTFQFEVPAALMPEFETRADGAPSKFDLQVTAAAEVDFNQLNSVLDGTQPGTHIDLQQIMNVTNIILKQQNADHGYPAVRNTVFPPMLQPQRPTQLSGLLELWNGFYQSVRPTTLKTINVDVSYSPFFASIELLEVLRNVYPQINRQLQDYKTRPATQGDVTAMNIALKKLKHIRLEYRVGNITRKCTFDRLTRDGARTQRFEIEVNGRKQMMSVEDYFRTQKGYSVVYPFLPLVQATGKNFIPLELCRLLPNQHCAGKLGPDEQSIMVRNSSTRPPERMNAIINYLQQAASYENNQYCNRFGVRVNTAMVEVSGRVIPGPEIHFGPWNKDQKKGSIEQIQRESSWNMERKKFVMPATIRSWVVVRLYAPNERPDQLYEQTAEDLCRMLPQHAKMLGMQMSNEYDWFEKGIQELAQFFTELCTDRPKPDLVIVLLPARAPEVYSDVKRFAELQQYKNGITTQCLGSKTMLPKRGLSPQHVVNILMKINQKMIDGENWRIPRIFEIMKIDGKSLPYVVMGADVNHPRPGADKQYPSLASLTCSLEPYAIRYSATFSVQRHHKETIEKLGNMVKVLLTNFYQKNNQRKPQRIVFYRDGVSEGEFSKCAKEVKKIRAACQEMDNNYTPTITYICVQKRHHTRLFTEDQRELNRSGNVPAGTTVDQGLTHPREFDFFLVSHSGGVGTSRPTHYHVIHDENRFSSDSLEQLTYYLCYLCARCSKSISYPAPCYYAHLMADRASHYIKDRTGVEDQASTAHSDSSRTKREQREEARRYAEQPIFQDMRIHDDLRMQMFFT